MNGTHILSNFYNCQYDLNQQIKLMNLCIDLCDKYKLKIVGKSYHEFEPYGITFVLLLAESHLSVHTWPENGNIAFDLYVCNHIENNSEKAMNIYSELKDILKPENIKQQIINREAI